jgi:hypothetical protein
MKNILTTAALAALFASPVAAFEMTGGTVSLSYSQLTEDSSLDRTDLGGSVEFGFSRNISAQVDLGFTDFGASGLSLTSFALHGIWHASEASSVGLFLGRDDADLDGADASQDYIGVEVGYGSGAFGAEAHFAYADADGGSGTAAGLALDYAVSPTIGIGGTIDRLNVEGADLTTFALRGSYAFTPQTQVYAEVGNTSADAGGVSEDSAFIGLGAEFSFGAARGATFDRRSLLGSIPGL